MTEQEFLASEDPAVMLRVATGVTPMGGTDHPEATARLVPAKASDRKLRLFGLALYSTYATRGHVEPGRLWAKMAPECYTWVDGGPPIAYEWNLNMMPPSQFATQSVRSYVAVPVGDDSGSQVPLADAAALLRDIIGNPFRPITIKPAWLTPAVHSVAQAAYAQRELPSGHLDNARLAVLSDALEEAGCTDADILSHLRSPGPHVRGCWALDLILGKE